MSEGPPPGFGGEGTGTGSTGAGRADGDASAHGPVSRAGWALVLALLAVPMAVIPAAGDLTVVSLWGFLSAAAPGSEAAVGGYPVWDYFLDQSRSFAALPASIRAWPLAIGFHVLAASSAASGVAVGREDRRVTGGLLVLAATASLWVSVGLATRFGVGITAGPFAVLPVGAVATLAVAAVAYGGDLRAIITR